MHSFHVSQQMEFQISGFFLSKDKGPDAEPTRYNEAALTLRIGGPGTCEESGVYYSSHLIVARLLQFLPELRCCVRRIKKLRFH